MLILQLLTILLQTVSKTNCRSTEFALVVETNQIAKSDNIYNPVNEVNQSKFFLLIF